jgi:putative transposase
VASAPSPPSPCCSSTSCSSVIAPGNGRPISLPSIASSSPSPRRKPGPKGPSAELIAAIIALKRRNPHFGGVRIAQQITRAFGVEIDKEIVPRVLAEHYARASIDGMSVCRMFNHAVTGRLLPKHVSTDHDALFRFHRRLANLRVREIEEVKSVPYAPVSHPFGTLRREYLDRVFFWNAVDLARKLETFRDHYGWQQHCQGLFELPIAA